MNIADFVSNVVGLWQVIVLFQEQRVDMRENAP